MKTIKQQSARSKTMLVIIILIATAGIVSVIVNMKFKNAHQNKWHMIQAQQASLNALSIAKEMFSSNALPKNCINTSGCPFWSSYPVIRLINKNGTPNKLWWNANAYSIPNSQNNAKFIIIKSPNDLYKIIAFAEDGSETQAIISSGYILSET